MAGWTRGLVLESKATDNFNAIDPAYIADAQGHGWLAFGSFWDGIKMRRLDDRTGMLSAADTKLYSLARRANGSGPRTESTEGLGYHVNGLPPDSEAIEAPSLIQHGGYFYLFTSWDLCCRGAKSTYHTVLGRSKSVTGPYVDESGKALLDGGRNGRADGECAMGGARRRDGGRGAGGRGPAGVPRIRSDVWQAFASGLDDRVEEWLAGGGAGDGVADSR